MSVAMFSTAADRRVLDDRRGTRAMTWIMAIMLFLTVLAAALGLGTINAAGALDRELAGRLTVQVVAADPAVRDRDTQIVLEVAEARDTRQDRVAQDQQAPPLPDDVQGAGNRAVLAVVHLSEHTASLSRLLA